jgi:hypothetical protein
MAGPIELEGLFELELHRGPTGEVDSQVGLSPPQLDNGENSQAYQDGGKDEGVFPLADEVEVGFS